MSYRMDAWQGMTATSNNLLINKTGMTNTGTSSCGSSETAQMISCFLNLGTGIAMQAMQAKASGAGQNTNTVSFTSLNTNATKATESFDTAFKAYSSSSEELEALEERKDNLSKTTDLQAEIDNFNTDDNSASITLFNNLSKAFNNKGTITTKIAAHQQQIKFQQAIVDKPISASGLSAKGQAAIGDANAMTEPGAVSKLNSAYGSEATNPENELYATYQRDLSIAKNIDEQLKTRQTAQDEIKSKTTLINEELAKLPEFEGISKPTTADGLEQYYSAISDKLNELGPQTLTGKDKKTSSLKELGKKQGSINQATEDAKNSADLDAAIKAKKAEVTKNKAALATQRAALESSKEELETAIAKIDTVIAEKAQMDGAQTSYDKAKSKNNRNFLQKMFGTGKSTNAKLAKSTYKAEKNEFKQANNELKNTYSDVANINNGKGEQALLGQKTSLTTSLANVTKKLMLLDSISPKTT